MCCTHLIHFSEMVNGLVAGLAFAYPFYTSRYPLPATRYLLAVSIVGGFLIASALVLLVLPRAWHAAHSSWWSQRIPVSAVRLLGPVSWAMGIALVLSVTQSADTVVLPQP